MLPKISLLPILERLSQWPRDFGRLKFKCAAWPRLDNDTPIFHRTGRQTLQVFREIRAQEPTATNVQSGRSSRQAPAPAQQASRPGHEGRPRDRSERGGAGARVRIQSSE